MNTVVSSLTIQNKKYTYSLTKKSNDAIRVVCEAARINQNFLVEDIAALIIDLPNLIIAEKEREEKQSNVVRFRVSNEDKIKIEARAVKAGFNSVSDYLRHIALV